MIHTVDKYSESWKAVEDFIAHERAKAVGNLIADRQSEQQRGMIAILDKLSSLPNPVKRDPVEQDTYL